MITFKHIIQHSNQQLYLFSIVSYEILVILVLNINTIMYNYMNKINISMEYGL